MIEQFYPTPPDTAARLMAMLDLPLQLPILEPSAGTGNLIEALRHTDRRWTRYDDCDFHCIEINLERAASLRGKGLTVIWSDFLTFNPIIPYGSIIMNPPFHDGAKHLLKALSVLADGGQVAAILNAETIRNPFSNERKILLQQLEDADYQCEFMQDAFDGTDVEIALIHAKKKASTVRCETFENFKRLIVDEHKPETSTALIHGEEDNIKRDILYYQATVKTALKLFDELNAFNRMCKKLDDVTEIFEMKNSFQSARDIAKRINGAFWTRLLYSEELARLMTGDVQRNYSSKIRQMREYEFCLENILQLKMDLVKNLTDNLDEAIMKVWYNFTARFHWRDEQSKNVHYYSGWKTNDAFAVNKKVIIPLYAFSEWRQELELYRVRSQLEDIEKVFNYLDNGRTVDSGMANKLEVAQAQGVSRGIDTKFFEVDLYKKGTCHLKFKDMGLLKKFNIYCGKKSNMLPDDYGREPYHDLDDEHKAVVDSFEGKDSYQETFARKDFYLQSSNQLLLTAGEVKT